MVLCSSAHTYTVELSRKVVSCLTFPASSLHRCVRYMLVGLRGRLRTLISKTAASKPRLRLYFLVPMFSMPFSCLSKCCFHLSITWVSTCPSSTFLVLTEETSPIGYGGHTACSSHAHCDVFLVEFWRSGLCYGVLVLLRVA